MFSPPRPTACAPCSSFPPPGSCSSLPRCRLLLFSPPLNVATRCYLFPGLQAPSPTPSRPASEARTPVCRPLPGVQTPRSSCLSAPLRCPVGTPTLPCPQACPQSPSSTGSSTVQPRTPGPPAAPRPLWPHAHVCSLSLPQRARGLDFAELVPAAGLPCGLSISHMERNSQALAGPGALGPSVPSDSHTASVFGFLCSPF